MMIGKLTSIIGATGIAIALANTTVSAYRPEHAAKPPFARKRGDELR
jgi:hypothetical protein